MCPHSLAPILWLILVLLAPDLASFLPLLPAPGPNCGMACCKRSGVCCCHKAHPAQAGTDQAWRAGNACGSGCARSAAVQGRCEFSLTAHTATFLCLPAQHSLRFELDDERVPEGIAFERFGRPPPVA